MASLGSTEYQIIDNVFDMRSGYVLDFSNQTFLDFFRREFGIDIYDIKYKKHGESKARLLRCFMEVEDNILVASVLRKLLEHKEFRVKNYNFDQNNFILSTSYDLIKIIDKLENENINSVDILEDFSSDRDLGKLILSIKRDIEANMPETCLDRLHSYCMKHFKFFIEKNGGSCELKDTIHGRMGKYIKLLEREKKIHDASKTILRSSISIIEKFNSVRNNNSFAHDNPLLSQTEAIYIFDVISAILRFTQSIEKC